METNHDDSCPLTRGQQTRNLLIFAACKSLIYLTAPVSYVGLVHAALFRELEARDTVANLPQTAYLLWTASPVLFAWLIPYVSWLRRSLVVFFALIAASYAMVYLVLVSPVSNDVKIVVVVVQSAIVGALNPASDVFLWEVMGRGVAASRRGLTLALAFGVGPILAAVSSFGSQLLLTGRLFNWVELQHPLRFPENFAIMFGLAGPMMAVAAGLCWFCTVPRPAQEAVREPFLAGVFGGFSNFLTNRVLLLAGIVIMLAYVGNTILASMNLYTPQVLGESATDYAGLQMAMRFSFKAVAGLLLGWILTKYNPRAGLLATTSLYVASQIWAICVSGEWYLVAFGIFGAGELVGVYGPNYVLSASRQDQIRKNLAVTSLLNSPVAPMGNVFGAISDHFARQGLPALGYQISFALCGAIILCGILLALFCLPARPDGRVEKHSGGEPC